MLGCVLPTKKPNRGKKNKKKRRRKPLKFLTKPSAILPQDLIRKKSRLRLFSKRKRKKFWRLSILLECRLNPSRKMFFLASRTNKWISRFCKISECCWWEILKAIDSKYRRTSWKLKSMRYCSERMAVWLDKIRGLYLQEIGLFIGC